MYNTKIVTAPVALFLGAGASRPFGKMLMGEFVDYLKNRDEFKDDRLFHDIVNVPEGRDLEHLFQELDEWSRKDYHPVSEQIYTRGQKRSTLAQEATRMIEGLQCVPGYSAGRPGTASPSFRSALRTPRDEA